MLYILLISTIILIVSMFYLMLNIGNAIKYYTGLAFFLTSLCSIFYIILKKDIDIMQSILESDISVFIVLIIVIIASWLFTRSMAREGLDHIFLLMGVIPFIILILLIGKKASINQTEKKKREIILTKIFTNNRKLYQLDSVSLDTTVFYSGNDLFIIDSISPLKKF